MLVSVCWSFEGTCYFQEGKKGIKHILRIPTRVQDQDATCDQVAQCTARNWVGLARRNNVE
jgi:hypothetical protein